MRPVRVLPAAVLLMLTVAAPAAAHALDAEVRLKGDRVQVEAFYSDNTPAIDARVAVRDEAQRTVAEGRTDDQGRWSFARPAVGHYRVTVDAGAGHRKDKAVTIPEAAAPSPDSAAEEAVTVSEGPGRAAFTRTPWERVALGLAVIALAALGGRWLLRRSPEQSGSRAG